MNRSSAQGWSFPVVRVAGVTVRVHLLLVAFAVLTIALVERELWPIAAISIGVLIASLAIHELGHVLAAWRLGGDTDEVVLSPVGGLCPPQVPNEPEPQVFVALAGPMVNLLLVVIAAGSLVYFGERDILSLLNPALPLSLTLGELPLVALKAALWLNWTLFLLNMLLPVYPFDAGPALRALLWPLLGRRTACLVTSRTAFVAAFVLLLVAVALREYNSQSLIPVWASLGLLAAFVAVSAQRDVALTGAGVLEDKQPIVVPALADDAWEDDDLVLVERHLDASGERHRNREADEDARVDAILQRLHDEGIDHLSQDDQALLQRASRRYRLRKRGTDE